MKLLSFFQNKIVKNAGWLISGRIIQMAINFVVGLLMARYLGPSNYGVIGYAGAYIGFFTSVSNLGINALLVKEFVDRPENEGEIIGTTLGLRAVSSFFSVIIIFLLSSILDHGDNVTIIAVSLMSISLLFQIFETFSYWFQSKLRSKITAIATLIAYILSAIYKLYLMVTGKNVYFFALVNSLDYLCLGIILSFEYWKQKGKKLSFSAAYGRKLLKRSFHFILPSLMVAIYGQTDKLMLKHMIGEAEVGYYTTAVSICSVWCFILSAIIDSVYPSIMEAHNKSEFLFEKRNKQLYAIIFYISSFVSILFTVLAKPIILILYGKDYYPSIFPLRIVTWYTAFSYLGVARNAWIVCENKQKYLFPIYCSAAVVNVILNLLLIPQWGTVGAAVASLAAQVITTLVTPFFISGLRRNSVLMFQAIILKGIIDWRQILPHSKKEK